ncbi:MAG: hypothetical protein QOH06_2605 [Acidobacteriota bacterium]|jgi:hypothetical protein|nr:hypothetical protein [Acidobacteriota bacterium]
MNGYEYALENDEFFENDESDEFFENDESDEFSERRRKRGGRPPRINPGRTGRGTGLFKPRPAGGTSKFVTQAQLEAGLARVGKQIGANSEAIKKVATQANKINSELGAATSRLDKQVGELKKEVKKQAETSLLLTLLQGSPQLEARPGADATQAGNVINNVQVKKQDLMLPLIMLSGGMGGGMGGGDSSNMLFLALALSGKL